MSERLAWQFHRAVERGAVGDVREWIAAGLNLNHRLYGDVDGHDVVHTFLMRAAFRGRVLIVRDLVLCGADVHAIAGVAQSTALLMVAASRDDLAYTAGLLIRLGADVNADGPLRELPRAASHGIRAKRVDFLVPSGRYRCFHVLSVAFVAGVLAPTDNRLVRLDPVHRDVDHAAQLVHPVHLPQPRHRLKAVTRLHTPGHDETKHSSFDHVLNDDHGSGSQREHVVHRCVETPRLKGSQYCCDGPRESWSR